jgi:hypothetical protein
VEDEFFLARALLQDVTAGDVSGKEVGRELDAAEVEGEQP